MISGKIWNQTLKLLVAITISLGGDVSITVVETPGHSIGSVTFVLDGLEWAFAADAVQMYGGAKSGIPTIEYPALYRQSVQHLLRGSSSEAFILRTSFRDANGDIVSPQVEGDASCNCTTSKSRNGCEISGRCRATPIRNAQSTESNGLYGPFGSIADEIGYTGDPRNLPCAFFVTMNGYQEELIGVRNK